MRNGRSSFELLLNSYRRNLYFLWGLNMFPSPGQARENMITLIFLFVHEWLHTTLETFFPNQGVDIPSVQDIRLFFEYLELFLYSSR